MHTLFLNLASHDSLIACTDDQSVKASATVHTRISDRELIPMVESVLEKAGWEYRDIDRIACIVGPGGFTSLRVAVTFTNVLSDQLGIESVGVHLSEFYRARICHGEHCRTMTDENASSFDRAQDDTFWLHSTKKDQLFVSGGKWDEPTLLSVSEFHALAQAQALRWCGELIPEHQNIINKEPIELQPVTDVLPQFLASQRYEKQVLTPWYGRGW